MVDHRKKVHKVSRFNKRTHPKPPSLRHLPTFTILEMYKIARIAEHMSNAIQTFHRK